MNHTIQTSLATERRLLSLDALRGFGMFSILGAEQIIVALA